MPTGPSAAASRRWAWARAARAVAAKELLEARRDRRTLVAAVLLPAVTMPLVVLAMPLLLQRQQQAVRDRPARVAAVGPGAQALAAAGQAAGRLRLVDAADARQALLVGLVDAVVEDTGEATGRSRRLALLFDGSRPASAAAVEKLLAVTARIAQHELEDALRARGTTVTEVLSISMDARDIASPERMGGALLATVLPFFVAVWALLGGQYAALDVGVGERERGSLEALLVTPPARTALVAGKFLAVLGPALLALGVMLTAATVSLAAGGRWLPTGPVRIALGPGQIAQIGTVGLALAALLSAGQLAVSLVARTLREAQQAFAGLYLAVAIPSMAAAMVDEGLPGQLGAVIPVFNAAVAFRHILLGTPQPVWFAATAGSLLALAGLVLLWGTTALQTDAPNR
ncbi:MAG: ABC transporter permease subunit [Armatimonadota bacterium]|nr:ABC transporter permease subunit [Armatimonadota bacterium]